MSRGGLRHQLPVHSPLTATHLARSTILAASRPRERLRRRLVDRFPADDAILFGSGTQALTAAIRLARSRAGVERPVALPAYTCYDMATAALGDDASLMLYDVDPATLAPDLASLEGALRAGAGVAVLAPLYGLPFDWSAAAALADRYGVVLVEDAAQAAGGSWEGRPMGTWGALTVLSFGRGKGWTGGGGGALLLRPGQGAPDGWSHVPEDSATAVPGPGSELTLGAAAVAQWAMGRPMLYGLPRALPFLHLGETVYHPPSPLTHIPRLAAALALATSGASMEAVNRRRETAVRVQELLASTGGEGVAPISVPDGASPGYLRFPVLVRDAAHHPNLRTLNRHGVETGYPTTLAALDVVRSRLVHRQSTPGAETLARDLLTLPTHERVQPPDLGEAVRLLHT